MTTHERALKTAVIGVGNMGKNHARLLKEISGSQLVAVADLNPLVAAQIASRYGVRAYTDYEQLIKVEQPQAIVVATPPTQHFASAAAALRSGAHVLVEKPITATLEKGQELIDLAKLNSRLLMVGHIVRFNPAVQLLKKKLETGELGRIFQITCRRVGPFPAPKRDVGVVIDLATHDLDLLRWLLNSEPQIITAQTARRLHTEHDDLLFAMLKFPGEILATIETNWLTPTKVREICVLGERGLLRVDDLTQDLYYYENAATREPGGSDRGWYALQTLRGVAEGIVTRYSIPRQEPLQAELVAFIHAIQNNTPAPISAADGLAALKLALELLGK